MSDTITSTSAPWQPLQPYLTSGFQRAENLYQQGGPQYYPNSTVAQFGTDTNNALNMFRDQATQGTPVAGAANQMVTDTLQGNYLNSNPYLDDMYNQATAGATRQFREAVTPGLAAQFSASGRSGSPAAANAYDRAVDTFGDDLTGMAANLYGQNYQNERGRQMQAAQLAPNTAQLSYMDANQLMNIGNLQDNKAQQNIEDQFNRYMFNQERPYDNLGRYFGYLGGNYGTTTTMPAQGPSDLQQWLGLGLTGLDLFNQVGGLDGLGGLLGLGGG